MCGITGWANLDSRTPPPDGARELLHSMCERMVHRGPDSEGLMVTNGAALGMRRLAIIDLVTGEQPTYNEDQRVAVVLNGEIYNYRELRHELEKRGHRFRSMSDTEVLPHLYEEHGDAMVQHLNGMFAFALWDSRRRRLLIARDRFGEKPLYWGVFDNSLLFASEPKVLLAHPAVKSSLNLQALRQYLSFDYVPAPLSIYEGINKLPAAQILTLEDGKIETSSYWRLSYKTKQPPPSEAEAADHLRELLADSVRLRLVSDVPLGVLLSGGVDSSTIAALAVRASSEAVKTFSISFAESSFDESSYARAVAKFLGTDHHEERLSANLAANLVGDIGSWMDEPFSDPSLVPTYLLSRFTRKHVTVALGGDGGDELFAGYPMYRGHSLAEIYAKVPNILRTRLIEPLVRLLPVKTKNLSFDYKATRFVAGTKYDSVARHHVWFGSFTPDEQAELLTAEVLRNSDGDIYRDARLMLDDCDATDIVERMQSLDTRLYLAEDILTKVDRASMAVSLEVRAPFLDPRVAEFAASLPANYKLRGRKTKYLLKRSIEDFLPPFVTRRGKKGFGVPVAEWLKGKLRPLARDLLSPERVRRAGVFNPAYVTKLQDEHERGIANHRKLLWTLLMFELWHESFIETPRRIETSLSIRQ
ncbi:MAG TPA: asparagine synthase (glutamine-hydrolyzing) [Blastocatellia bacterium]|jgi:asparagine synthase (glutamine-hydrolysing)|nr:asparagine synthase (glutamine-hydrolyzing) [Blastocatellia bacterium]HCX30259.1 asparagine synthase (glutamine-hydrolyzing) [Blastocatellia bacterium]